MNSKAQNIEMYLTKSAKEELDKIISEEREKLLGKAEKIAKSQLKTERLEISLRDIIEAKDDDVLSDERNAKANRKKEVFKRIAVLSGIIYAILGVGIYLVQNKKINVEEDLGLIVALVGSSLATMTFLLSDFPLTKSKTTSVTYNRTDEKGSDDALVIIGRWMLIEKMLSKMIESKTGSKVTSFNQIITFLNSDGFNPELATTIKNLLKTRNAVAHNQIETTETLVKGYIHLSGSVIEQLEDDRTFKTR